MEWKRRSAGQKGVHKSGFDRPDIGGRIDAVVPLWNTGAQGVSLFSVISGLVMTLTSRPLVGRPGAFRHSMPSRIIRIVPLCWMLNLIKIAWILIIRALPLP